MLALFSDGRLSGFANPVTSMVRGTGFVTYTGCISSTGLAAWFRMQPLPPTRAASRAKRDPVWLRMQGLLPAQAASGTRRGGGWFRMQGLPAAKAASHPHGEQIGSTCRVCRLHRLHLVPCESPPGFGCRVCRRHGLHLIHRASGLVSNAACAGYAGDVSWRLEFGAEVVL